MEKTILELLSRSDEFHIKLVENVGALSAGVAESNRRLVALENEAAALKAWSTEHSVNEQRFWDNVDANIKRLERTMENVADTQGRINEAVEKRLRSLEQANIELAITRIARLEEKSSELEKADVKNKITTALIAFVGGSVVAALISYLFTQVAG